MEEDGGDEERPEIKAITEEEQSALAKNLDKLGKDKWKLLFKKLGFKNDEVRYLHLYHLSPVVAFSVGHLFTPLWFFFIPPSQIFFFLQGIYNNYPRG